MKSARILAVSAFAIRTVRALAAVEPGAIRRGRGHAVRPWPHRPRTDHPTDYPTYAPTYFPTGDGGDGTARPTDAPSTDDSEDGPCPLCSYAIAAAAPPGSGPVEGVPVITTTTTVATPATMATTETTATEATTETTVTEATTATTAGAVGAETSPEYDAFDFNNLGPFGAGDRREDPTQENPTDKKEVDPVNVNGLEFRPTPVVEAMANGASSNDFAIVVAFAPLLMSVLSSIPWR